MIHILKRKGIVRHMLRRCAATAILAVLAVSFIAAAIPDAMAYEEKSGVVVNVSANSNLNVRQGPGTGYGTMGSLSAGAKVTVVDEAKATDGAVWYKIKFGGGYGYVHSDYVRITSSGSGGSDVTDEEFRAQLIKEGFPESYISGLMELHEAYPNWVFKAMNTGYEWDYAVKMEYRDGVSLVENSFPSSWKCTEDYAYDWEKSEWIIKDSGRWVCASWEIIEYYMDPRNFMGTETVFQFLEQTFNGDIQTVDGVQTILNGSFMEGKLPDDPSKTYAQVIYEASEYYGVNPYVIASMILNEQGTKGSALSDGTYPGYEGYYNFFNINAVAQDGKSAIERGLTHAKNKGWNTRTKSIYGGVELVAEGYVSAGQSTLYLKRFNVQGSNAFYHQYMTSVYGAKIEGVTLAEGYSENTRQTALTFTIPVYENMPSSPCTQPTGDGSPNIKLKSLSVSGYELTPDFQPDILEYSLVVPAETGSVTIEANAMDSKATVSGAGTLNLTDTVTTFTVRVTAENKNTRDYVIKVGREATGQESFQFSGKFAVTGTYVVIAPDIAAKTVTEGLLSKGSVIVTLADGSSKDSSAKMCTGDKLLIYGADGESAAVYTAAVKGDVNGDGAVSSSDFIKVRNHILNSGQSSQLTGAGYAAADVDMNDKISSGDFIKIRNHILRTNLLT